jgi:hypothetical protein
MRGPFPTPGDPRIESLLIKSQLLARETANLQRVQTQGVLSPPMRESDFKGLAHTDDARHAQPARLSGGAT